MTSSVSARKYANACAILQTLEVAGYPSRLVGGCVRDRHLGIEPSDYDLATTALPEQVKKIFEAAACKVIPTGMDHGTLTVLKQHQAFEVTTLRRDVATDGRRAVVAFSADFREDAARRDFTMNAMSEDLRGIVYDFFDGRKHLAKKMLVFVGDPHQRIREDYLRILRFFRFKGRLDLTAEPSTLAAIADLAGGLAGISRERITAELAGILACSEVHAVTSEMVVSRVLATLFPELGQISTLASALHATLQSELTSTVADTHRVLARLAVWLLLGLDHTGGDPSAHRAVASTIDRLRLSNHEKQRLLFAVGGLRELAVLQLAERAAAMDFVDRCEEVGGPGSFEELYAPLWKTYLRHAADRTQKGCLTTLHNIARLESLHAPLRRMPLPLSGRDVMNWTGLPPGEELGRLLSWLKTQFRNGHWQTREEAKALLDCKTPDQP